jgi:antitoxin HicB
MDGGAPDMRVKGRIGSSFDDFLKQEGIYEEVTARAVKRPTARHLTALIEQDQGSSWPDPQNR